MLYRGRSQYRQNFRGIIEVILEEKILEECKMIEIKILEVDIKVASGKIILEEVEVDLEKDSIQVTLGGMIEEVVDQDHIQA